MLCNPRAYVPGGVAALQLRRSLLDSPRASWSGRLDGLREVDQTIVLAWHTYIPDSNLLVRFIHSCCHLSSLFHFFQMDPIEVCPFCWGHFAAMACMFEKYYPKGNWEITSACVVGFRWLSITLQEENSSYLCSGAWWQWNIRTNGAGINHIAVHTQRSFCISRVKWRTAGDCQQQKLLFLQHWRWGCISSVSNYERLCSIDLSCQECIPDL